MAMPFIHIKLVQMCKYNHPMIGLWAYTNIYFSMKDLGEAAYILGIKIYRDRSRRLLGLSQSTYMIYTRLDLLYAISMTS